MSLSTHDRKILWAKAGNQCSFNYEGEDCLKELAIQNGDNISLVGDEAHIVGGKPGSARYQKIFSDVDTYGNRILLCKIHHKTIDDNESDYTDTVLDKMKKDHENKISLQKRNDDIKPLIIKDSVFITEVENADLAIGMEINQPAELSNVKAELKTKNVKKSIGFSTNQGMTIILKTCPNCGNNHRYVCTGPAPTKLICPHCKNEVP